MSTLQVGTISEKVTDAGVAVDGVTLKDGGAVFTSAVTATDNTVDLGASSTRFKDLYLSGGVYLGGTGSANFISDYENGTWTPTVNSGTIAIETNSSRYIKVGNLVTAFTRIKTFSDTTSSSTFDLKTLPFTISTDNPDANIGSGWGNSLGDHRSMFFYPQTNSTTALVYYGASGSGFNQVLHSDFNSSTDILIRLHYVTA